MASQLDSSIKQAAQRIRDSKTIAVVLPDAPAIDAIGSAAALVKGLKRLGKIVSVFRPPLPSLPGLAPWSGLNDESEILREFIISFDLSRSPVRELKYERDQNRLNIVLSPTGSRIRREDVEFRYGGLSYDLAVTIGVPAIEAANASIALAPDLLHEKPVLNIDANPANRGYGEMNLLAENSEDSGRPTIPEIVWNLLGALEARPNAPEDATALLSALAASTKNFHPAHAGAEAFLTASELLRAGANGAIARQYSAITEPLKEKQLAGRAMVRSRFDEKSRTLWSVLTKEDFLKTSADASGATKALNHLVELVPNAKRCVLLYQEPGAPAVAGLIFLADAEDAAGLNLPESQNGNGRYFASPESYSSFVAAEEGISRLLRPADAIQ